MIGHPYRGHIPPRLLHIAASVRTSLIPFYLTTPLAYRAFIAPKSRYAYGSSRNLVSDLAESASGFLALEAVQVCIVRFRCFSVVLSDDAL